MADLMRKPEDVEIVDNPEEFVTYANINRMYLTPEEGVFHYALRIPETPNRAKSMAKIYLSIPHVKRIAIGLVSLIQQYEAIFGEIPPEPEARLTEEGRKHLEKVGKEDVGK